MLEEIKTNDCKNEVFWYAIYTMPRSEKKVQERLILKQITTYLPLVETIRYWTDRKKKIQIPLIPGFVFIQCEEEEIVNVLQTIGVVNVVRYLKKPAKIRDYEINNLKILSKEPCFSNVTETLNLVKGEIVEVIKGSFVGLIGRCIRIQGKHRIIIELKALEKIFEVNVPYSFLQKKIEKVA